MSKHRYPMLGDLLGEWGGFVEVPHILYWVYGYKQWHAYLKCEGMSQRICTYTYVSHDRIEADPQDSPLDGRSICPKCRVRAAKHVVES